MKRYQYLLFATCFTIILSLFSKLQGQTIEVMKAPLSFANVSKVYGNSIYTIDYEQSLSLIDYMNTTVKNIAVNIRDYAFTDSGVYFIKNESNNNIKFLYYHQPGMSTPNVVQITDSNVFYYLYSINTYDNKAVVKAYLNKEYIGIEFDGVNNTSVKTSGSLFPIEDAFKLNNELATVQFEYGYTVIRNSNRDIKFKYDSKNKWKRLVSDNQTILFTANGKLFIAHDLDSIDADAYSNLQDLYFLEGAVSQEGRNISDSFVFGIKQNNDRSFNQTYTLNLFPPYGIHEIPIPEYLKLSVLKLISSKDNYHAIWNFEMGIEMATLEPNDSLRLVTDLNKGMKDGLSLRSVFYPKNDSCYVMASNGSGRNYIYLYYNKTLSSLFPIDALAGVGNVYNNELYWYTFKNDTLYVYKRNLNDLNPEPHNKKYMRSNLENEWQRNFYFNYLYTPFENYQYTIQNGDVCLDPKGNVIFSSTFTTPDGGPETVVVHSDTNYNKPLKGSPVIVKYDANGNLLWSNSIAGNSSIVAKNNQMCTDAEGNIYISSICFDSAWFDNIQAPYPRSVIYICKLNNDDGHVEWVKFTHPSTFSNDAEITAIHCQGSRIFIGINNELDYFSAFGEILRNESYPFPVLMVMDTNGNHLFSRAVPSKLPKTINYIRTIRSHPNNDKIYLLMTQGTYNTVSTCNYYGFKNKIMTMSSDGQFDESFQFEGNDINIAHSMIVTPNEQVFTSGYFRKQFSTANFNLQSLSITPGSCYKNEGYLNRFQLLRNSINPAGLRPFNNPEFYPYDMTYDEKYIYILGVEFVNKTSNTCIKKFNLFGKLIATRNLDIYTGTPLVRSIQPKIIVKDSFFYINLGNFGRFVQFNNYPTDKAFCSFLKLDKTKNWELLNDEVEQSYENGKIIVSPNPASTYIQLQFTDENSYKSWEIIDALGRKVLNGTFNSEVIHTIDLQILSSGYYTLLLKGNENEFIKIIVQ
jgi:hypothetical protein